MLKLRIFQPGQEDRVIELDSNEVVLGRAPNCDVTIGHSCVSKQHVKLMTGLVLIDMESSNGTSVEGQRIKSPVLLRDGVFQLGGASSEVSIEVEYEDTNLELAPQYIRVRQDLDSERQRVAALSADLASAQESQGPSEVDPESLPIVQTLRYERDDLTRRMQSLRDEIEARDVEASEGLQARLASEALGDSQRANQTLQARVAELEGQAASPAVEAAKNALAARVGELEADLAEYTETIRCLRLEVEDLEGQKAAEPAPAGADMFFKIQGENARLRRELEEAQKAPTGGSPELFVGLQAANKELLAEVDQLKAAASNTAPAPLAVDAPQELLELKRENHALTMSKADLAAELDSLREKVKAPSGSVPTAPTANGPREGHVTALLDSLASEDLGSRPPLMADPTETFITMELFRFLRMTERIITRMAGGFLQLFDQHTVLPDTSGNVRGLLALVLASPDDEEARSEFVGYMDELGRWLVVALGANRRAAERFAEEIKSELSERNLIADDPIPKIKKLAGKYDAELWLRASKRLGRLTPDIIEERLTNLTSVCAEEIRREQDH